MERPVLTIGNLTLRHLSMGAQRWLIDVVANWIPADVRTQDLAYAWAMAHSETPEALWAVQGDRHAFLDALRHWERTIGVSYATLKAAIDEFIHLPQPEQDKKPTGRDYSMAIDLLNAWKPIPGQYLAECQAGAAAMLVEATEDPRPFGWLIEMLVREYPGTGRTAEDWFWRTPGPELEMLLNEHNERKGREAAGSGKAQTGRFLRAHHAFRSYVDLIRKAKGKP
jgi:hypothetical protein